jgi:hypothetical protein
MSELGPLTPEELENFHGGCDDCAKTHRWIAVLAGTIGAVSAVAVFWTLTRNG